MLIRASHLILAAGILSMALSGCGNTVNPGTQMDQDTRHSRCIAALTEFRKADPSLDGVIQRAFGYAIFPEVTTGGLVVGGAYGRGEVYSAGKMIGTTDISEVTIGAQVGGQKFAELILFQNEASLLDFQHGTTEVDGKATAVIAKNGAGASADYTRGVEVFVLPNGGAMVQAAVGVQKFRFTADGM